MLDQLSLGKKAVGLRAVLRAVSKGEVSAVFMAADSDLYIRAKVETLCNEKRIPLTTVTTMEELGKACGIQVGAAAAALLK